MPRSQLFINSPHMASLMVNLDMVEAMLLPKQLSFISNHLMLLQEPKSLLALSSELPLVSWLLMP